MDKSIVPSTSDFFQCILKIRVIILQGGKRIVMKMKFLSPTIFFPKSIFFCLETFSSWKRLISAKFRALINRRPRWPGQNCNRGCSEFDFGRILLTKQRFYIKIFLLRYFVIFEDRRRPKQKASVVKDVLCVEDDTCIVMVSYEVQK